MHGFMSINGTKQSFWLISSVKLVLLTFYHILSADAKIKHGKWRLNSIPCFCTRSNMENEWDFLGLTESCFGWTNTETNALMWGGIEHLVLFIVYVSYCPLYVVFANISALSLNSWFHQDEMVAHSEVSPVENALDILDSISHAAILETFSTRL